MSWRTYSIHPADTGGVRPQARGYPGRQSAGNKIQIFENPRAGPVQIGSVLENDVDEGKTEKRVAPDHLGKGDAQHGRGQRVGDLVFDHLGRLAGVFGVDDHLNIRKIRNGVKRCMQHRQNAAEGNEQRGQNDHELVVDRPLYDFFDHALRLICPSPDSIWLKRHMHTRDRNRFMVNNESLWILFQITYNV